MQWRSARGDGIGEILDISPSGVGFKVPVADASQVGPSVALNMELAEGLHWCVTDDGTVLHKIVCGDGTCRIGVEFSSRCKKEAPGEDATVLRFRG